MDYRITCADDVGYITRTTERGCPKNWEATLIAMRIVRRQDAPLIRLMDMVDRDCSRMGNQVAFVDEDCTYVVTRLQEA